MSQRSLIYRLREAVARIGERLADLGHAIVSPFERGFSAIGGAFMAGTERLEGADSLLIGVVRLVTWPFRILWRLLAAIGGLLLPAGVRQALVKPFLKLGAVPVQLGGALWRLIEKLNLDGLLLWIAWLTKPVWRPIAALGGFFYAWLATRDYRGLLWGIPAVLLLLPVIAAAAWGLVFGRESVATDYRVAVQKAVDSKDYKKVQFYERKLALLGVDTQRTDFKTAEALAKDGKVAEAYERMQRLAPEDRPGYPQAHLWIVQQLLKDDLKLSRDETHRLLDVHLKQLEVIGVEAPEIKFLRAAWFAEDDKLPKAVELLKPLVHRMPMAAMQRMSINLRLRNVEEAKSDARAVRAHFEDRQRRRVAINAEEYRWWTIAEGLLGDMRAQSEVVDAWQKEFPKDEIMKAALADRARRQVDEQLQAARPDARQIASRLIDAAELGGDPSQLHRQVGMLFQERKRSPVAAAAIEELSKSPDTPAIVLQLLGTHAVVSGEAAEASKLLKRAVEKNPKDAIAWNNYACSLLELPNSDMNEALTAVNKALAIAPEAPQFRETRGQVLVRLKQWDEAVADLELAINGMPNSKTIHRSLADAYAALGQQDLANIHREQSQ